MVNRHTAGAVNGSSNGPAANAVRAVNGDHVSTDGSEPDNSDVVVAAAVHGGDHATENNNLDGNGDVKEPLSPSQGQRSRLQTSTSSTADMRQGFGDYDAEVLRELEARYQLYYTEVSRAYAYYVHKANLSFFPLMPDPSSYRR